MYYYFLTKLLAFNYKHTAIRDNKLYKASGYFVEVKILNYFMIIFRFTKKTYI